VRRSGSQAPFAKNDLFTSARFPPQSPRVFGGLGARNAKRGVVNVPRAKAEWWVYLLKCRDGTLYTGITTDAERRLAQHNAGTASKYTRSRRPVSMVYREPAKNHGAALKREIAIKKLTRTAKDALVASQRRRRRPTPSPLPEGRG
jgi:putative endonuclease